MRMRWSGLGKSGHAAPLLVALALVLLPAADLADHGELHTEVPGFVHDEAAHPDAAPHLEQEEHLGPEVCHACVHSSSAATAAIAARGSIADARIERLAPIDRVSARVAFATASPRGPPA